MIEHKIRPLEPGETSAAVAALVDAFERDPLSRWLFPDGETRRATHAELFGGLIAQTSAVVDVTGDLDAAAIWLPPEGRPELLYLSSSAPLDVKT